MNRPHAPRLPRPPLRLLGGAVAVAAALPIVIAVVAGAAVSDPALVPLWAGLAVAGYSVIATLACASAVASAQASTGVESRTWWLIGLGLVCWSGGGVAYIAFLALGGNPQHPEVWSQAGYLLAYPFWYGALWFLRQPVLAVSRRARIETIAIEAGALLMLGTVVASVLWHDPLPVSQNVAQLIPALLDVLLLAAFSGTVRRSSWSRRTALTWIGNAFAVLAGVDLLVTYLVTREDWPPALVISGVGYVIAMALLAVAARYPLRVAEAQRSVRTTASVMAVLGLALVGVASVTAPAGLRPAIWFVGALLAWRTLALIGDRESSDADVLTGFLEPRAFERHLGGVIQHADEDRPSVLIAIDLDGFAPWNARNGYAAGDTLVERTTKALETNGPPSAIWGRIGQDRFALTVTASGDRHDRALAERLRHEAARAAAVLDARAGLVMLPADAANAAEAVEAADEALRAAAVADRHVVAYTRGALDGLTVTTGSASHAQRLERIQRVIASSDAITMVLQPVVRLGDLKICGFEALARFHVQPAQGPDHWIAEATQLGLGVDLELECLRRARRRLHELPDGTYLSLNASPDVVLSDGLMALFGDGRLDRIVLEVTEHDRVTNYPRLASRLAALRGRGARIAIDDTGAGHASLNHVIELRPDYIKLDRGLVQGVDGDAGKYALVHNMLGLAGDLGARMIAEGIETEGELAALRRLGVPFGQGYLLGRPTVEVDEHTKKLGVIDVAPVGASLRGTV
jgi:diguanylate cyclase (GGDEF)-like protein